MMSGRSICSRIVTMFLISCSFFASKFIIFFITTLSYLCNIILYQRYYFVNSFSPVFIALQYFVCYNRF
nr:MAG TPA: hypothetical protein [Caudoviricetes sp.]